MLAHETLVNQEDEKLLIQRAYRNLLKSIKSELSEEDKHNIRTAYEMAVEAHKEQRRKSGEPYILHPIEVARICAEEIGLGPTAIIAALLHDVVEDTPVTVAQIKEKFGERIAKIVDGLTKLDGEEEAESPQAENFKKVLSTLVEDVRVVLIKMADRLHNMRTLGSMPRHKQLKIAAETAYIYAPLAHRLGLYAIKTEFQDLSLKITDREAYDTVAQKLSETKRERDKYIDEFIVPLRKALDEVFIPMQIPYRIFGRSKSIYSIWNKIKTKDVPFETLYDLFAVRIVLDVQRQREKAACWIVYSTVTDVHTPIPDRLKDWVTTPKSNGYESLHTTVIGHDGRYVEVQIRSERMDEIAERGFAAHWKYKGVSSPNGQQDVYESWLDSVRELLEQNNGDSNAVEFIHDFKTNLFNEEVFIYTPKGDMRVLPKGATALDFAFSIHSDVGYHCAAIKVNEKLVPMGYKLQNTDRVSVITSKNQKPNEDWLKMVVTGKARAKIRTALKEEKKKQGQIGRETLERKLQHLKVDFEENVDMLARHYGFNNRLDFFYAITFSQVNLSELKSFRIDGSKLIEAEVPAEKEIQMPPTESKDTRSAKKKASENKPRLLIGGEPADRYEYSLATCCNPVQGDDVFAYLTANAGMKIHRTSCPNATHLMASYGYRIMKAEWSGTPYSNFVADLEITGIDTGPGVIERLSHNITTMGLNIRSMSIAGKEGYFKGKISLIVPHTDQLNMTIRALKLLDGVSSVRRIEN